MSGVGNAKGIRKRRRKRKRTRTRKRKRQRTMNKRASSPSPLPISLATDVPTSNIVMIEPTVNTVFPASIIAKELPIALVSDAPSNKVDHVRQPPSLQPSYNDITSVSAFPSHSVERSVFSGQPLVRTTSQPTTSPLSLNEASDDYNFPSYSTIEMLATSDHPSIELPSQPSTTPPPTIVLHEDSLSSQPSQSFQVVPSIFSAIPDVLTDSLTARSSFSAMLSTIHTISAEPLLPPTIDFKPTIYSKAQSSSPTFSSLPSHSDSPSSIPDMSPTSLNIYTTPATLPFNTLQTSWQVQSYAPSTTFQAPQDDAPISVLSPLFQVDSMPDQFCNICGNDNNSLVVDIIDAVVMLHNEAITCGDAQILANSGIITDTECKILQAQNEICGCCLIDGYSGHGSVVCNGYNSIGYYGRD
jgi:hypothetical protein